MILKFKTNCGWQFIDKVDECYKDECVYPLNSEEDFIKFESQNDFNVGDYVEIPAREKQAGRIFIITRGASETKIAIPHSAQVFLLNDYGKTIERLN